MFELFAQGRKVKKQLQNICIIKTLFHHIIHGSMIQTGDIVFGDGSDSQSIYGGIFPDENFKMKNSNASVVSMGNSGPDSNGSQFFITTVKAFCLNGQHVGFGKFIQRNKNTVDIMARSRIL
jgi:cyclophilin family peptidyl-prolyl cis-trans isomerase